MGIDSQTQYYRVRYVLRTAKLSVAVMRALTLFECYEQVHLNFDKTVMAEAAPATKNEGGF